MSLNRLGLGDVSDLKIKLLINFEIFNVSKSAKEISCIATITARCFNPASQVAIQPKLSDGAHVQGSSVVQRELHEHDVKKKHHELFSCLPKYLCKVLL